MDKRAYRNRQKAMKYWRYQRAQGVMLSYAQAVKESAAAEKIIASLAPLKDPQRRKVIKCAKILLDLP